MNRFHRSRSFLPSSCWFLIALLLGWPRAGFGHPNHAIAQIAAPSARASRGAPATPVFEQAVARLTVTITDAKHGEPTAARVRITDESGQPLGLGGVPAHVPTPHGARLAEPGSVLGLPSEAIGVMYGWNDTAQGFAFQPDGSFYVKGSFDLPMPAGTFLITITKGYEFVREREAVTFEAGDHLRRSYALRRWIDMPARGWYSADDHIHLRRSPRENPLIRDWIAAEDVHVGVLLQVGDFWTTYFSQYAFGQKGRYAAGGNLLVSGQEEPRTGSLGHTLSFGADQFVRFRDEYFSYDKFFDRLHALGGVTGYAHQAVSFSGYRGMTLDVLSGKIDFLELMQFCVPEGPLALEHYYHFLDLGFKVTALAGSDFPWCGRGGRPGEEPVGPQIGDARFYTYVGAPFSFDRWFAAVKAGHTFVTTGPMLELSVNGRPPGSSLDVQPGATLRISVTARGDPSRIPLQQIQLIGHGNVLAEARAKPGAAPGELTLEHELTAQHGLWIAARADAGPSQMAHTTPVYVTVNGGGFQNRANLAANIERAKRHLDEIRALLDPAAKSERARSAPGPLAYPASRTRLEQRIAEAERKLAELR